MNAARNGFGPAPARSGRASVSTTATYACLAFVFALLALAAPASAAPQPVATIEIEGVISPVTLRLVGLAIDRAQAEHAQALIIQLDTPGGLARRRPVSSSRSLRTWRRWRRRPTSAPPRPSWSAAALPTRR